MKIALVGDIALFGKYSLGAGEAVFDYFAGVANYLQGFDLVVGNLETPFGRELRARGPKSAYIKSDPTNAALLRHLNVQAVNLANNHIFDYGVEGYRSTLETLQAAGIDWFGADGRQLEVVRSGGRVAMHGYCSFNTNPLGVSRNGGVGVNPLNVATVEARLRENRGKGLLNIVSIHSGQEHVNFPSRDDVRMARRFARVGPYVYYGHHPHVLQGLECVGSSVIAYSLGNFCFDDVYTDKSEEPLIRQSDNNRQGAILELEVDGDEVRAHRVTPLFAGACTMELGSGLIATRMQEYSAALRRLDDAYDGRRDAVIASYLAERKQARDLRWYLKRMNLNSVGILLRARYNRMQYRKNVSAYLSDSDSPGAARGAE